MQQMGLEFPCMLSAQAADSAAARQAKVIAQVLKSPLKFFETLEGPNKDPTFVTALPTEALRMYVKHIQEMYQNFYNRGMCVRYTRSVPD